MGTKEQATEFFRQLGVFSDRYVKEVLKLPTANSPWGDNYGMKDGAQGAIIHYTADEDLERVLRWFLIE